MGYYSKQASIYFGALLVCASYTFISPFYPGIAKDKGMPVWLIGLTFSFDPVCALITSLYLGHNMFKFGRRLIFTLGIGLLSLSMFTISLID